MRVGGLLLLIFIGLAFFLACGSDSGPPSTARQTLEAAIDEAEGTPVDRPLGQYASQLCEPFKAFLDDAKDTLASFEALSEDEADIGTSLSALRDLESPMEDFVDRLRDVDPPDEFRTYHDGFVRELTFAVEGIKAINEGGLLAALAFSSPPPTPQEPAGFEAAIIQQCGDELADLIEEFGSDFFDSETPEPAESATPSPIGAVGQAVRGTQFEIFVSSVVDPVLPSNEFFQPEPGLRWVAVDVSITNISGSAQDYGPFDFTLRDSDNFEYQSGFIDLDRELSSGSLRPDETIRGEVGFAIPMDAGLTLLIFEPGFLGDERIDIRLP